MGDAKSIHNLGRKNMKGRHHLDDRGSLEKGTESGW
jgi:hypothetical protein